MLYTWPYPHIRNINIMYRKHVQKWNRIRRMGEGGGRGGKGDKKELRDIVNIY